jgi:hypothetical protein
VTTARRRLQLGDHNAAGQLAVAIIIAAAIAVGYLAGVR